ncbi:phage major tail tube protein [Polycladidibacter hongkongensis]|uniref:phage major tail tube protein n=1 Tax=Polycladidibacter hongkongensis TaxID=1647556 RepID=UPI00082E940C|nr:phage major tail tube protein [Pseudovibrio hongkongensis]
MAETFRILKKVSATCSALPDVLLKNTIEEVALPNLEEVFEDFEGAGNAGHTVEFSTGLREKLEVTLKLMGTHSELLPAFGQRAIWTLNGVVEDERDGSQQALEAEITGQLAKLTADSKSGRGLHGHDAALKGIMSYRLTDNGAVVYHWDYFGEAGPVIGGIDRGLRERQILMG